MYLIVKNKGPGKPLPRPGMCREAGHPVPPGWSSGGSDLEVVPLELVPEVLPPGWSSGGSATGSRGSVGVSSIVYLLAVGS